MRKKYLSRILLGGLIIASTVTLNSCKDYDDDIDGLQEQIDSLSSLHDSEVSTLESSISTLQSTASSLSSEIADVQEELEAAIAEKADESEVEALQSEVASLTASLSQVESAISTLETAADHDADIAELETALAEANADIAAAQTTADEALTAATTANETLTALITSLATVQSNITTQLETLESDVKDALQNAANAQADATAALTYITKLQELEAEDSSKIAELESAQASLENSLTDLDTRVTAAETAITELWAAVNAGVSEADMETIQGLIDAASDDLQTQVDEINDGLDEISEDVENIKTTIFILYGIAQQLKSLVFSPELYWGGIEAIKVPYYTYTKLTVEAADKTANQNTDTATETETTLTVAPVATASYYLNPSTAAIYTETSYYNFIGNTAEYVSRSTASDGITIEDVEKGDGQITVSFNINDEGLSEVISNIANDYVDVVALQYTANDTVVTSDFAALYIEESSTFYINLAGYGLVDDTTMPNAHLATTAADAIATYTDATTEEYPYIEMAYTYDLDGVQGTIDLDNYINVHKTEDDILWGGQATINEENFKLVYELIGYIAEDSDGTSESEHASINGSELTIHKHDAEEYSESRVLIGRTPLVRVTLVDETNDAIAAVGYILVVITDVETEETTLDAIEIETTALDDSYTIACDDTEAYDGKAISWKDVESKLLDYLDMSKDEFEDNYELDTNGDTDSDGNELATQYVKSESAYTEATDYIGEVYQTTDPESYQTQILWWTIDQTTAYNAFVTEESTELTTYVKFNSTSSKYSDIYIKLTWAPSNAPIDEIVITLDNSTKKESYWYTDNESTKGYADVHFEIGNPTTSGDDEGDFDNLVLDYTFSTTPSESVADALSNYSYDALTTSDDYSVTYYFVATSSQDVPSYDVDGTTYTTSVKSDTEIGVTESDGTYHQLATIEDQETGEIQLTTDEDDLEVLELILNSRTQNELKDYLTFTVGIKVATCDPAGSDFISVDELIDVIVVTPLFVTDYTMKTMQWNVGKTLEDQEVRIKIVDYNGYDYAGYEDAKASSASSTLISYYGIESITLDTDNAITNFSNSSKYEAVDTNDFTLTFSNTSSSTSSDDSEDSSSDDSSDSEDSSSDDSSDSEDSSSDDSSVTYPYAETDDSGNYTGYLIGGTITLNQEQTGESSAFTIKIPMVVTYTWGEIEGYFQIDVQASPSGTSGSAKK